MQKLEEILRAEETARHAVADAREQADALVRDAEAKARSLTETERSESARAAVATRETAVAGAQAAAAAIATDAASRLEADIAAARTRIPDAAQAALAKLLG